MPCCENCSTAKNNTLSHEETKTEENQKNDFTISFGGPYCDHGLPFNSCPAGCDEW